MTEKKHLFEELPSIAWNLGIPRPAIPDYIFENIRYELFDWQKNAIKNFLSFEEIRDKKGITNPTHLLFNMATGTGKTLLMASLILYYYNKGYRHFIFFVNQNNIVGKTEENLTNPYHLKYLFKPNIIIADKTVRIRKVEAFSDFTDDIQILFTSIHKLHNAIYVVKENSIYLDDLQKRNIVMLGDEAHHLNAATKKSNQMIDIPT
jgi:type III restriction enzyme